MDRNIPQNSLTLCARRLIPSARFAGLTRNTGSILDINAGQAPTLELQSAAAIGETGLMGDEKVHAALAKKASR
jgi:hypothetical protein